MSVQQDAVSGAGRRGRAGSRGLTRVVGQLVLLCSVVALAVPMTAAPVVRAGATITVNTLDQEINGDADCSLQEAIYSANRDANTAPDPTNPGALVTTGCTAGSGTDTIELPPMNVFTFADPIDDADNFVGPSVTPIITSTIIIEGRGARLQRVEAGRPTRAFVVGATGHLDLREVHLKDFFIHGGDGGIGGGGGGMGAGGAIFVEGGSLLVRWSTFEGNGARGGDGGDEDPQVFNAGGGGGGLSGDGGDAHFSGGGGGGSRGNGGNASSSGDTELGGGGGGRVTSAVNHSPGQPCGAAGGESGLLGGDDGDSASPLCPGGGGGGGTEETIDLTQPGDGGGGSYGGGGGGGGFGAFASGDGGDGGFGAGGGGAPDNDGGDGGFGGGGGQGNEVIGSGNGQGGTFAGDGSNRAGGGGAGLGGAIFGHLADVHVINSTFFANAVERGLAGVACGIDACARAANDGRGAGGAIFLAGGALVIESSTFAGNASREYNLVDGAKVGLGGGAVVVYDPEGSDEATLLLRNTILAGNDNSECYTRNGVTTSGSQGNIILDNRVNTNGDVPCPGVVSIVDPGLQGLSVNKPGRTPTMAIESGSSAVDAAVGASPADDQRGILRPQGNTSDIGAYEVASIPPVTTITLAPASPNGSNSWYKTAVGVTVAGTDVDGTIDQTRCALDPDPAPTTFGDLSDAACAITSVGADGVHWIYAASRDDAGNVEATLVSATFMIDATAPTLSPSLNVPTPVTVGQTGVVASPNASDATSGVASSSCGSVDTSTPGVHTVTCTATDNAGNSASSDLTFVVEYRILGFFSPVPDSHWKVGQRVPIKVALADGAGNRISDAEATQLARDCRVMFSASGIQSQTPQCLKYDPLMDQFIYTWKLAKSGTGSTTITVAVSYPGTAITTVLSELIEITP